MSSPYTVPWYVYKSEAACVLGGLYWVFNQCKDNGGFVPDFSRRCFIGYYYLRELGWCWCHLRYDFMSYNYRHHPAGFKFGGLKYLTGYAGDVTFCPNALGFYSKWPAFDINAYLVFPVRQLLLIDPDYIGKVY